MTTMMSITTRQKNDDIHSNDNIDNNDYRNNDDENNIGNKNDDGNTNDNIDNDIFLYIINYKANSNNDSNNNDYSNGNDNMSHMASSNTKEENGFIHQQLHKECSHLISCKQITLTDNKNPLEHELRVSNIKFRA